MIEIWVELSDGAEFLAFHWFRDLESGIRRAKDEAPIFGYHNVKKIYGKIQNND